MGKGLPVDEYVFVTSGAVSQDLYKLAYSTTGLKAAAWGTIDVLTFAHQHLTPKDIEEWLGLSPFPEEADRRAVADFLDTIQSVCGPLSACWTYGSQFSYRARLAVQNRQITPALLKSKALFYSKDDQICARQIRLFTVLVKGAHLVSLYKDLLQHEESSGRLLLKHAVFIQDQRSLSIFQERIGPIRQQIYEITRELEQYARSVPGLEQLESACIPFADFVKVPS